MIYIIDLFGDKSDKPPSDPSRTKTLKAMAKRKYAVNQNIVDEKTLALCNLQ